MVAFAYSAGDAVTAVDSGKRALEILGSVRVLLSAFVHWCNVHYITLHYITSDAMCILVTRNRRSSSRSRWWSCPPRTFRHGSAGSPLNHPIPLPILYVTFLLINRNWWEATTTIWISVHFFFRCMEEGAEDFLLKPVRPSDISRITTRMLHWSVATTVVRLSIVFCSYSGRSDRVYSE